MEELIYLIVKAIIDAMGKPKDKAPSAAELAWQRQVWEQQRLMQQAALQASRPAPVAPPPPRPKAAVRKWAESGDQAKRPREIGALEMKASGLAKLMQPASLRRRFILTEVLRPPVGLR